MTLNFSGNVSSLFLMTLKQNNAKQRTVAQKEGTGLTLSYSKPHFSTPIPVTRGSSLFYISSYTTD